MRDQWAKLKDKWGILNLREKQAVLLGCTAIIFFIIYQFIWSPFLEHINVMRQRIVSEQKNLLWMQSANKTIKQLESQQTTNNTAISPVVLMSVMQKAINHAGLSQFLTQLKQVSNDSVEVQFQKIEFDKLISMLIMAIKQQNMSISQITLTAEATPGVVSADILLVV
ncbi:MAG: type II secretion system protein M [Gammaproteobacteria bacterium]|nr:type II secretion system protein M [Gammaproteobacteria bacterium]